MILATPVMGLHFAHGLLYLVVLQHLVSRDLATMIIQSHELLSLHSVHDVRLCHVVLVQFVLIRRSGSCSRTAQRQQTSIELNHIAYNLSLTAVCCRAS